MKKIIATLLTATLVVANVVPAFADGVDGAGAVEYNNSEAITYDKITLPTIAGSTYDFTLDPQDLLHTFASNEYDLNTKPGVYFKSVKTEASFKKSTESGAAAKIYSKSYTEVTDADVKKAIVTEVNEDGSAKTVTSGFFVYAPTEFTDLAAGTTATGKAGDYLALTSANIGNYCDISEADNDGKYGVSVKTAHFAGNAVCDGKLYTISYTEIAGTVTNNYPTVDLNEYFSTKVVDGKTVIDTVKGVYKDGATSGEYVLAAASDIAYTPAVVANQITTDKVTVINKSTKDKTVKAVVTMSNVGALKFKNADSFTDDATASVFFKATDGTAANDAVLAKASDDAATATATYTLDVPGATVTELTYQGGTNSNTGGHDYFRFEAPGTAYNNNSFWITAKANSTDAASDAWVAYGDTLDGTNKPAINIVYTVTNKKSAEEAADEEATTAANTFKSTYAEVLALTTETVEYEDLEDVNAALTAYAALDAAVKAKLTTEKALLDGLKTAAEAKETTEEAAGVVFVDGAYWLGKTASVGFDTEVSPTEVTLKCGNNAAVDVTSAATVVNDSGYWVSVTWDAAEALGLQDGTTYVMTAKIGTVIYTGTVNF